MTREVLHALGFTTTWDYTTLKLREPPLQEDSGFTTTWDYTTLKRRTLCFRSAGVLLPLGITLLSNSFAETGSVSHGFTTTWDYTTLKLYEWAC